MQIWIGIVLGVVIGLAIICLPPIIQQAIVSNLMASGTRDVKQDLASAKAEGTQEDAVPGERLPILVAMVGLGVGFACFTYLIARGRKA